MLSYSVDYSSIFDSRIFTVAILGETLLQKAQRSDCQIALQADPLLFARTSFISQQKGERQRSISPLFLNRWRGEEKKVRPSHFFFTSDSVNSLCREILHFCEKVRIAGKGCIAVLLGGKLTEVQKTFLSFLSLSCDSSRSVVAGPPSLPAGRKAPFRYRNLLLLLLMQGGIFWQFCVKYRKFEIISHSN